VHQNIRKRDLELDLFATQRGRAGQSCYLGKGARELLRRLDQRRTRQRLLPRPAPTDGGLRDLPGLGAVTRYQCGLVLGNLRELTF
jgi:hypothetical protein